MKVVVNRCFGGFSLSDACLIHMGIKFTVIPETETSFKYREFKNPDEYDRSIKRDNPKLIKAIETLGAEACSGECAKLEIVEIPDNLIHWHIDEYDGSEAIIASESEIHYF